jgi:hypothetical protein
MSFWAYVGVGVLVFYAVLALLIMTDPWRHRRFMRREERRFNENFDTEVGEWLKPRQ